MNPRQLITLEQPEGGAEHGVMWMTHHGCADYGARRKDRDVDLLHFGVGVVGYAMPQGVPFEVVAQEPCPACGVGVRAWFQWKTKLIIVGSGT